MIGVIANIEEQDVVREFFELFKTPWEFYRRNRRYDVVLCTGEGEFDESAPLALLYAGTKTRFDEGRNAAVGGERTEACVLSFQGKRIPIYGRTATFAIQGQSLLTKEGTNESVAYVDATSGSFRARIGYDLFREVRSLLTTGQPIAYASMPALDLHIEFLRTLITACGVSLVEIPPVPEGFRFIACLTHDVDHPSLRHHQWDSTTIGFLFRAVFESCWNLIRGHISLRDLLHNWLAALKLPFVQLGWAKDFWRDFDDRYLELEEGLVSTFFVIPFKNRPGRKTDGAAPGRRAAGYQAKDLANTIRKLTAAGHEVGLHGIDAWLSTEAAGEELREIQALSGASEIGARMHWLYFNGESPAVLEKAGVAYDSTIGYNETVGYRAGTTQAFGPLEARQILELPMHVMDTALFYHSYLGLTRREAKRLVGSMIENASRLGGCLTINWHDRSLAPERLWGGLYAEILQELKDRGAWFATAGEAVGWFKKRRSASFDVEDGELNRAAIKLGANHGGDLPSLRLRRHEAGDFHRIDAQEPGNYVDVLIHAGAAMAAPFETNR